MSSGDFYFTKDPLFRENIFPINKKNPAKSIHF